MAAKQPSPSQQRRAEVSPRDRETRRPMQRWLYAIMAVAWMLGGLALIVAGCVVDHALVLIPIGLCVAAIGAACGWVFKRWDRTSATIEKIDEAVDTLPRGSSGFWPMDAVIMLERLLRLLTLKGKERSNRSRRSRN